VRALRLRRRGGQGEEPSPRHRAGPWLPVNSVILGPSLPGGDTPRKGPSSSLSGVASHVTWDRSLCRLPRLRKPPQASPFSSPTLVPSRNSEHCCRFGCHDSSHSSAATRVNGVSSEAELQPVRRSALGSQRSDPDAERWRQVLPRLSAPAGREQGTGFRETGMLGCDARPRKRRLLFCGPGPVRTGCAVPRDPLRGGDPHGV
jgi:hypothetical protein